MSHTTADYSEERSIRVKLVLALSVTSVFGLFGNGLLLCFYGNNKTRVYRSRDAIYIRRQAFADILVCAVVIPYTVMFEADLITNNILCKGMEFVRHFLVYMSHLLLYTYSWELPTRRVFSASKTYSLNTFVYSILMSLLASAPTFFIYRVDKEMSVVDPTRPYTNPQEKVTHHHTGNKSFSPPPPHKDSQPNPLTCRLVTNMIENGDAFDVKSLTWVYVILPILVYSMSLYWFLINFASYVNTVDYTLSRKDSLFLSKLEDVRLFRNSTMSLSIKESNHTLPLPISMTNLFKSRQSENVQPVSFKLTRRRTYEIGLKDKADEQDEEEEENSEKEKRLDGRSVEVQSIKTDSESAAQSLNNSALQEAKKSILINSLIGQSLVLSTDGVTIRKDDDEDDDPPRQKKAKSKTRVQIELPATDSRQLISKKLKHRRGTGIMPFVVQNVQNDEDSSTPSTPNSEDEPSRVPHIEIIELDAGNDKKKHRPILADSSNPRNAFYPQIGSYKKSMAFMILFDLLVIIITMIIFLLTDGTSMVLSLVHLKCFLTFYILSLLNPYLRHSVWGKEKCPCLPEASDRSSLDDRKLSARPSALQVSFVRERYRQKKAMKRIRNMRRVQQLQLYGTEI